MLIYPKLRLMFRLVPCSRASPATKQPGSLLAFYIYIHVPGSSEAQLISSSNYHSNSHRELTASKKNPDLSQCIPVVSTGPRASTAEMDRSILRDQTGTLSTPTVILTEGAE